MYEKIVEFMKQKPPLYTPNIDKFWDDEHISKQMLAYHLNPYNEPASRNHAFIQESVNWISRLANDPKGKYLLDLGCGPGIYAERFNEKGFIVTGIDFSKRSVEYAKASAASNEKQITYLYQDYLEIDYENQFDIITLIYCDFGVLNPENRHTLLCKIKKALRPGGILILDGATDKQYAALVENQTVEYCDGGFWSADPYICIQRYCHYAETCNHLDQYIVISDDTCRCFNIWNQSYDSISLGRELTRAGFKDLHFYDDVCGKSLSDDSNTICVAAR